MLQLQQNRLCAKTKNRGKSLFFYEPEAKVVFGVRHLLQVWEFDGDAGALVRNAVHFNMGVMKSGNVFYD